MSISNNKLEFGDYQTPTSFCDKITKMVSEMVSPDIIFEPTFGEGHFIDSSLKTFKAIKIYGNEINSKYYTDYKNKISEDNIKLFNENIFEFKHDEIVNELRNNEKCLIIGNPPWVTNSQLMTNEMENLPKKSNFKNLKGIDSITGASNFDISEYIIVDLLSNYKETNTTVAMLCKTNVVTNIMKSIDSYDFKISNSKTFLFDAKKVFNVACEACLFVTNLSDHNDYLVETFDINEPTKVVKTFGWKDGKFVSCFNDLTYDIDGKFFTNWRQGLKHDCSKVMELEKIEGGKYVNKLKENVELEDNFVYPLLKSSDLKNRIISNTKRYVIVPQKYVRQDTSNIEKEAPQTWGYLNKHLGLFRNRKSSIYKNCPDFSIFGIGDYSFSKYKVAISGFYKTPNFVLVISEDKPIMLDDTCYFVGFSNLKYAFITMVLLNSEIVKDFLKTIAFVDKKRPYTKDILMRIDVVKLTEYISFNELTKMLQEYNYNIYITEEDYLNYKNEMLQKCDNEKSKRNKP